MDHVSRGQVEAGRDARLSGRAAVQPAAGLEQPRPGGTMNRTIDTAAAEQAAVGGVDDPIDIQARDVGSDSGQLWQIALLRQGSGHAT
jgi:hypothetical protein